MSANIFNLIRYISQYRKEGLFSVANFREELYYNQDNLAKPAGPSLEVHSESYEGTLHVLAQQKMESRLEDEDRGVAGRLD